MSLPTSSLSGLPLPHEDVRSVSQVILVHVISNRGFGMVLLSFLFDAADSSKGVHYVYLTTPTVAQNIQRRIMECFMKKELERIRKKMVVV
jgi:hypothetical protein